MTGADVFISLQLKLMHSAFWEFYVLARSHDTCYKMKGFCHVMNWEMQERIVVVVSYRKKFKLQFKEVKIWDVFFLSSATGFLTTVSKNFVEH